MAESDRVVQVWAKGRAYPLFSAVALVGVVIAVRLVSPYSFNSLIADMVLLVVAAVLCVLVAFTRKLTLTSETLILRQLNGTKTVHLSRIVLVVAARPGILRPPFLQPVWLKLDTDRWRRSKALGWSKDDGIETIKQAVRTIGGTLERDEPQPARFGPSPLTDPGPVLQEWHKGRFLPLVAAFVALALLGLVIGVSARLSAPFGLGTLPTEILVAVVFMIALLTATGRKLTLTKNTLIVRKLLGFHRIVIPLYDIVSVRQRAASIGAPSDWQPVFVERSDGATVSTKSLGAEATAGIIAIREAVSAAGGQLEKTSH